MRSDIIPLENEKLRLEIARSIGPRILGLSFEGSSNLLAELPDHTALRPDGKTYHFYGGHRIWISPEDAVLSYDLEDSPVEILPVELGVKIKKQADTDSGIEKSIQVVLPDRSAKVVITHELKNCNSVSIKCAPWAITQLRPGGVAVLPMNDIDTGLLPNQNLVLWPYTDLANRNVRLGRRFLLLNAFMESPFKVGFANSKTWLAYWLEGILFVKSASYEPQAVYPDFGCSSECYCNDRFIELETLGPIQEIQPGDSIQHVETWQLFHIPARPENEQEVQQIFTQLDLR
jgi:hypothetical protein